jgi:hypothetical protein
VVDTNPIAYPDPKQKAPAAAHGFRSVPRALLVERAQKDKAKAHKLGDKVMKSMGQGEGGGGGGPSALQR